VRGEVGARRETGRLQRGGQGEGGRALAVRADDLGDPEPALGFAEEGEELPYAT
jgi:hypothetical protein